jgi:hypothetical protein
MNNQEKFNKDLLQKYLNPEKIEKAPEDFTENVMMKIRVETEKSKPVVKSGTKYFVPVFSVLITLILIAAAYLSPSESNDPIFGHSLKFFEYINNQALKIRIDFFSGIDLPGWTTYFFIGILFFALFDKVLHDVFQREK